MKIRLLWALPIIWAAFFFYLAVGRLQYAWEADGSFFNMSDKLEAFLAGVGAIAVGALPLYLCYLGRKFYNSRERSRLGKKRKQIDKRIDKLDRKSGVLTPQAPPAESKPADALSQS